MQQRGGEALKKTISGKIRIVDTDGAGYMVYVGDTCLEDVREWLPEYEGDHVTITVETGNSEEEK